MHPNSYSQMTKLVGKYLNPSVPVSVLDIGSYDVNGTYKPLFGRSGWQYTGADISAGPNIDVVIDEDYEWKMFQDGQFDVVISGQAMEHMECPWLAAKAMYRVCKVGGLCIVTAPAIWPFHPFPKDCWRIFADGMRALMVRTAGFAELECFTMTHSDEPSIPNPTDTFFVGKKNVNMAHPDLMLSFVTCVSKKDVYEQNVVQSLKASTLQNFEMIPIYNDNNQYTAPQALNIGIDKSTTNILITCHQDVIFPPNFTTTIMEKIHKYDGFGIMGVAGIDKNDCGAGGIKSPDGRSFEVKEKESEVVTLDELCLIVRKDSKLRFDESLDGFHLYGVDICLQSLSLGMKNYAVDCEVVHLSKDGRNNIEDIRKNYLRIMTKLRDKWSHIFPSVKTTHGCYTKDRMVSYLLSPVCLPVTSIVIETRPEMMGKVREIVEWHRRFFKFDREIVVSYANPNIPGVEFVPLFPKPDDGRSFSHYYSYFCIKQLNSLCNSGHMLIWQADGFITNPTMWTDDFLQWDYVGAPVGHIQFDDWHSWAKKLKNIKPDWESPLQDGIPTVGNGGFSLRSKKFLEACANLECYPSPMLEWEDMYLCVERRRDLEAVGIKFAPIEVANVFAKGNNDLLPFAHCFGFHGQRNLIEADEWVKNYEVEKPCDKKKICIVTAYTPSGKWKELGELTTATMKSYADKHGYDLKVFASGFQPDRDFTWSKVKFIRAVLKSGLYDWVWWLDSDAAITNHTIELENLVSDDFDLFIGADSGNYHGRPIILNAGSFLIRNCDWSIWLLDEMWKRWDLARTFGHEQEALSDLYISNDKCQRRIQLIPFRKINGYMDWHAYMYNKVPENSLQWHGGDFVAHPAGYAIEYRIEFLKKVITEYTVK